MKKMWIAFHSITGVKYVIGISAYIFVYLNMTSGMINGFR